MPHRFFFSSRRRHTRSLRDWSSDVCSSDLTPYPEFAHLGDGDLVGTPSVENGKRPPAPRSEERRVGKECRSRWSRLRLKFNRYAVQFRRVNRIPDEVASQLLPG